MLRPHLPTNPTPAQPLVTPACSCQHTPAAPAHRPVAPYLGAGAGAVAAVVVVGVVLTALLVAVAVTAVSVAVCAVVLRSLLHTPHRHR